MLASREIHGIEVHDIYASAWEALEKSQGVKRPANVGDYVWVSAYGWYGAAYVDLFNEAEEMPVDELAKTMAHFDAHDLQRMTDGKTHCFDMHEIWHIVADPVTEEEQVQEQETDEALTIAKWAFEQARGLVGMEMCEYIRGWLHGVADTLDDTQYAVWWRVAWSADYDNDYIKRVELVRYDDTVTGSTVLDFETC